MEHGPRKMGSCHYRFGWILSHCFSPTWFIEKSKASGVEMLRTSAWQNATLCLFQEVLSVGNEMYGDKAESSLLSCWGTKHLRTSNVETQYYKADRFLLSCWGTKHLDFRALKRNNTTQIPSSCHAEARSILDFQASRLNITKQIASSCHTEVRSILDFKCWDATDKDVELRHQHFDSILMQCFNPTLVPPRKPSQASGVEMPHHKV